MLRARERRRESCRTRSRTRTPRGSTCNEAAGRIELAARSCLAAMAEGDTLRTQLAALRRLAEGDARNTVAMRRRLADATVAKGGYLFA